MPPFQVEEWGADTLGDLIPIVDISCFAKTDDYGSRRKEQVEAAQRIRDACKEIGFFYIKGHGMSEETFAGAFDGAKEFFDLPKEIKKELDASKNPLWRGYTDVGGHSCTTDVEMPDLKETYTIGEVGVEGKPKSPLHGPNQWPNTQCEAMATKVKKFHHEVHHLVAMRTLRALAVSLNQDDEFFTSQCDNAIASMVLIHYPHDPSIVDQDVKRQGCGAHTDWGFIAILAQDSDGLQVRHKDGRWIHAPPAPNAFLVNIGNMAARWTANLYKSTEHRAYNPSATKSRISIPFFITPNYDTKITTFEECTKETGNSYPPFVCGEHMLKQLGIMYDEEEEVGDRVLDEPAERAKRVAEEVANKKQ